MADKNSSYAAPPRLPGGPSVVVHNVFLPFSDTEKASQRWTVECSGGRITNIAPSNATSASPASLGQFDPPTDSLIDGTDSLLVPSLCHSHIHLDKCFILDRCGDLIKGDFTEAMRITKTAKVAFRGDLHDLYSRGARIIRESVHFGVTSMRAHVEVDASVGLACLETALLLQKDYHAQCDVQIAIFAQEPLFSSKEDEDPGENWALLRQAASYPGVSVVGSAPYVEPTVEKAKRNISLIFDLADAHGLALVDFHLDYNLDPNSELLIYEVISQVKMRYRLGRTTASEQHTHEASDKLTDASKRPCPHITIGHASRLQLLSHEEWRDLVDAIAEIPLVFVGLPQSDMYMLGRESSGPGLGAARGTLRVPHLAREYGIDIAMSVNNVDNAFTPQGSLDPLSLRTFGISVFQAATPEDVRTLVRSVGITSKRAIGLPQQEVPGDLALSMGDQADFVVLHGRSSLRSAVLNPPFDRTTVKAGQLVAYTRSSKWISN